MREQNKRKRCAGESLLDRRTSVSHALDAIDAAAVTPHGTCETGVRCALVIASFATYRKDWVDISSSGFVLSDVQHGL